jgi:hypothetical protein
MDNKKIIIGNTTATPNPQADWNQTDDKKADYIKNKPTLGDLAALSQVDKDYLTDDIKLLLKRLIPHFRRRQIQPFLSGLKSLLSLHII